MSEPDIGVIAVDHKRIGRDHAADAVAIVRLLRQHPGLAMFIISAYQDDPDGLEALCGSLAAFGNSLLTTIQTMAVELNKTSDVPYPDADGILARAACAVVVFDPDETQK